MKHRNPHAVGAWQRKAGPHEDQRDKLRGLVAERDASHTMAEVFGITDAVPKANAEVAAVLGHGASKHRGTLLESGADERPASVHMAAALRHVAAYERGERHDPETGLHPLAHAAARLLLAMERDL